MSGQKRNINEIVVRDKVSGDLQIIDTITGEVVSSSSRAVDDSVFTFSYATAMLICQQVAEGKTLTEIGNDPDFPPLHVINHWQRSDRMFQEEMILARKSRANHYHDKVATIAQNAAELNYCKDDVPVAKLAADTYKWLAEKGNPERFGNKVTHEGSTEKPIVMRVINTGIQRTPKPDVIVTAETKEVTHVEEAETTTNQPTARSGAGDEYWDTGEEQSGTEDGDA